MEENELSYKIRGCIFTVYNKLGPGLLESAYEAALVYELKKKFRGKKPTCFTHDL